MTDRASGDAYEVLPYPGAPYWYSHPDNLFVLATLFGLEPAPIESARILEIGCATGRNLLPMAAQLPDADLVGVELSAAQVEAAERLRQAAGLDNVAIRCADLCAIDDEWGGFDYIVSHGVYSWVPESVRRHLLELCCRRLRAGGIAYLSYNTLPGWHLSLTVRDFLRRVLGPGPIDRDGEQRALGALETWVGTLERLGDARAPQLRTELDRLSAERPGALAHDHLESTCHPVYFEDLVEGAATAGLTYISSAFRERLDERLWPAELGELLGPDASLIRRQQLLDHVANTRFRATLFGGPGARPLERMDPTRVEGLWARCELSEAATAELLVASGEAVEVIGASGRGVVLRQPAIQSLLVALGEAHPRALPVARAAAPLGQDDCAALVDLYLAEVLQLHSRGRATATDVASGLRATRFTRAEAAAGEWVTDAWHRAARLTDDQRRVIVTLDGLNPVESIDEDLLSALLAKGVLFSE